MSEYVEAQAEEWAVGPSQGVYKPSPRLWKEIFDPLFAAHRATNPNIYHNSLNRFIALYQSPLPSCPTKML